MLMILIDIVLPVFLIVLLGIGFGRWQRDTVNMATVNMANVLIFCPALVLSALLGSPISIIEAWPLIIAGAAVILIPGILLRFFPLPPGVARQPFVVPGMFRNTGNIGIPIMLLAFGQDQLPAIIILFVLSNLLQFSVGVFLLSNGQNKWLWLRNPNIWAAVIGVLLAPYNASVPQFFKTAMDLLGQIAVPLMLFSLGVRMSQDRISTFGLAIKINLIYLLTGVITIPLLFIFLPLTPEWKQLLVIVLILPPAVLNYLLAEQYGVAPRTVASIVFLGNLMSIFTIPAAVWFVLNWI